MRSFFREGDVFVGEVQQFFADGSMSLHTRSLKYGKLRAGVLVKVPCALIRRRASHFHTLPMGVQMILGVNGWVWVGPVVKELTATEVEAHPDWLYGERPGEQVTKEVVEAMARVLNAVNVLKAHQVVVHEGMVMAVVEASTAYQVKDMLRPEVQEQLLAVALAQVGDE
jgi:exosome complex component RRP4